LKAPFRASKITVGREPVMMVEDDDEANEDAKEADAPPQPRADEAGPS